jgi:AraC-like DNA-binding protein
MDDVGPAPLRIPTSAADERGATRLGFHELCRSVRFDVFRESLNSVFYPARVTPTHGRVRELPASRLSAANLQHLTLGLVCFGVETSVDPGALGAYHVNVPISGAVESHCGRQQTVAVPGTAAVFTPREHTVLPRWGHDAAQLCIKISRRALEDELEGLLGHPVASWVRFDLALDVTIGPGRSWLETLRLLLSELDNPDSLAHRSDRHREYLERLVIGGLVLAQRHDYADELRTSRPPARPRTVRRVIEAVEAAPEKAWSLADMARQAGVSGRRLQQGFAAHVGITPTAFLRRVRLERAHEDLTTGLHPVTDVAYRWGFTNLGRFAHAYRERFGEAPSETLRRSR